MSWYQNSSGLLPDNTVDPVDRDARSFTDNARRQINQGIGVQGDQADQGLPLAETGYLELNPGPPFPDSFRIIWDYHSDSRFFLVVNHYNPIYIVRRPDGGYSAQETGRDEFLQFNTGRRGNALQIEPEMINPCFRLSL